MPKPNCMGLFLNLMWKSFFRAPQWETKLVVRIIIGFFALYMLVSFLFLGVGLYFILEEQFQDESPMQKIQPWLLSYFTTEFLVRYFLQSMPSTHLQPLLVLPLKRTKIVRQLLLRSTFSFYNATPWIIGLPFVVVCTFKEGFQWGYVSWWIGVLAVVLLINLLNFLVNKSNRFFWVFVGIVTVFAGLSYADVFTLDQWVAMAFQRLLASPLEVLIYLVVLAFFYQRTFTYLRSQIYLDKGLKKADYMVQNLNLPILDRLGKLSIFLRNDIRLIVRNVRTRQVIFASVMFLFYALIFATQEVYSEMPAVLVLGGLFVSGGFLMTFGQNIPAWDSEHYPLLMSQNLSYREYLLSKWWLMVVVTAVSALVAFPYLFISTQMYLIILIGAVYNMGVGSLLNIYSGVYNQTRIALNVKAKAFENTKAFSLLQFVFVIPKVFVPMGMFYAGYKLFNFEAGLGVVAFTGILGFVLRDRMITALTTLYTQQKYKAIAAFKK